jgi:L-aspartate oxidase
MSTPLNVVVVGSGVAGMAFAHRLSTLMRGKEVMIHLLSKAAPQASNSNAAQGGVAAVIHPSDSWQRHRDDTLCVGAGRCIPEVVERVVKEGPACIEEMLAKGARFDLDGSGHLAAAREGGHSAARVVHRGDRTGAELVRVLQEQVKADPRIRISETRTALDLITEDGPQGRRCTGLRTVDVRTGELIAHHAHATVLATGGSGQVYRHTTNPAGATGAGVAMAIRARVPLRDMAFVQFHPTALYAPDQEGTFLISEAVRGAGGVLLRPDGTRLMEGLHPMSDLAPRNVVARAIHAVMEQQQVDHVLLDSTGIGGARFAREFPMILDHCWSIGLDPLHEPIPVMPAAHYLCGGIATDADGRTVLPGLFALGECAGSGLHGADRLASNSLLEALVIPRHAAAIVADLAPDVELPDDAELGSVPRTEASPQVAEALQRLRNCMTDRVGIVRRNAGLLAASMEMKTLLKQTERQWTSGERSTTLIELRDMLAVSTAICDQAMRETANAGAHYNADLEPGQERCAFPTDALVFG